MKKLDWTAPFAALLVVLLAPHVPAQSPLPEGFSDGLSVSDGQQNTGIFSILVGEFLVPEANNEMASFTALTQIDQTATVNGSTIHQSFLNGSFHAPGTVDRLNSNAGVWILTEPGTVAATDFTVGQGQSFADVLTTLNLQAGQISDAVGILSITTTTAAPGFGGLPVSSTLNTVTFGLLNDGDPNLVNDLTLFSGEVLHFVPEPLNAPFLTIDVSAALNNAGNSVTYVARFTSDAGDQATVPDGGATISMLGLALTGITFLRRKLS